MKWKKKTLKRSAIKRIINNKKMLQNVYHWALRFPGHGFSDLFSEDELKTLLEAKQKKGSVL